MVVIPNPILLRAFNKALIRGNVIRTRNLTGLPSDLFKRIILLNKDFNDSQIYYCLTTSKTGWYTDYWHWDRVSKNCIYCLMGETSNNPTRDMVIDLREVYEIDKKILFDNFKNKILSFLKPFSADIMNQIDDIIKDSKLIALKHINKIL